MQGSKTSSTVVVVVAIYLILVAIYLFCTGAAAVGCGGFLGSLATVAGQSSSAAAAGLVSGLIVLLGIVALVLAVAGLVVAVGMFLSKPWSYQGALIVNGVIIALELISLLTGGLAIWQIVLIVLSGVAIYFLLTDQGAKEALGQS
jgi:hypothetical protein